MNLHCAKRKDKQHTVPAFDELTVFQVRKNVIEREREGGEKERERDRERE